MQSPGLHVQRQKEEKERRKEKRGRKGRKKRRKQGEGGHGVRVTKDALGLLSGTLSKPSRRKSQGKGDLAAMFAQWSQWKNSSYLLACCGVGIQTLVGQQ